MHNRGKLKLKSGYYAHHAIANIPTDYLLHILRTNEIPLKEWEKEDIRQYLRFRHPNRYGDWRRVA